MGKKCIPGVICVENMTLFLIIVILILVVYLYYIYFVKMNQLSMAQPTFIMPSSSLGTMVVNPNVAQNPMSNLYAPPLKMEAEYFPPDSSDIRGQPGIPINVPTRGFFSEYSQIGILTPTGGRGGENILPLMGRRSVNGRDKKQYYTMSASGNLNTKLPVSVNGKSCTSEYGCNEISSGDVVYVEGYNDTFRATIYENGLFSYIPFL
jgi:hypothetical protein